jgi:serine phosphatase RsbU (regulator of sigma subunit)
VRAAARHGCSHDEVMAWANQAILLSDRDLFCTGCYGTLSRHDDRWMLRIVSSGHPLPIVCSARGTTALGRPGTLLGVFDDVTTNPAEVELTAGDVVVLYTDGVTDLRPPHDLTAAEMLTLVESACAGETAREIAAAIRESVLERVPARELLDDIAIVVLRIADR